MKPSVKKSVFGFSAVNAGQRNVAVEPQLVATSTLGQFRLTAPITRALGIAPGDYVMFINNINDIDAALKAQTPQVVEFAEEQGLELGSAELAIAMHKEFDVWGIAKGIALYNSKGIALTVKERLTYKDKVALVEADFENMLEGYISAAQASGDEDAVAAITREDITREEQVELIANGIEGRELPKFQGSKTANPSGLTGVGLPVTFTDTNVWSQLKADMEDKEVLNRSFDINTDEVETVVMNNGHEDVKVSVVFLGTSVDAKPTSRATKE